MSSKTFSAVVDQIDGQKARLTIVEDGQPVVVPSRYLPEGTREGCVLRVSLELDETATRQRRQATESLIKRLESGD